MDQKPVEESHAGNETNDHANNKSLEWRYILDWGFWAGHPLAVFSLFFGGILLAAITSFPGGNPKHLWYFAGGLWISIGVVIWWIFGGIIARLEGRELLTSQEIEERETKYKDEIQKRLNALEFGISDAKSQISEIQPRKISTSERKAIADAIAPYAGQKIVVQCHHWNVEAMRYAQEFIELFEESGWECEPVRNTLVPFDFYNLRLGVGNDGEAAKPKSIAPDAFLPLYNAIVGRELADNDGQYRRFADYGSDTIVLQVAAHPEGIKPKSPKEKNSAQTLDK